MHLNTSTATDYKQVIKEGKDVYDVDDDST